MTPQAKESSKETYKYYIPGKERITNVRHLIEVYKKYYEKYNSYGGTPVQINGNPHNLRGFYFRGQGDFYHKLLPSIGRYKFYKYAGKIIKRFTPDQEGDMLHRFRRRSFFMRDAYSLIGKHCFLPDIMDYLPDCSTGQVVLLEPSMKPAAKNLTRTVLFGPSRGGQEKTMTLTCLAVTS